MCVFLHNFWFLLSLPDLTNDSSDDEGKKQPAARVASAAAAASSSYVKKETKPSVVLVRKKMIDVLDLFIPNFIYLKILFHF